MERRSGRVTSDGTCASAVESGAFELFLKQYLSKDLLRFTRPQCR